MKSSKLFLAASLLSMIFFSCDVDNYADLIDGESSNVEGTWMLTEMTQEYYIDGVLDDTTTDENLGTFTFGAEGDGTYSLTMDEETGSGSFEWFEKNEKLFMNFVTITEDIITDNFAIAWDMDTDTETLQKWSATITQNIEEEDYETGQITTHVERTVIKVTLTKE